MNRSSSTKPRQVRLLGVPLDNVTPQETLDLVFGALRQGRGGWVLTPNLDILRRLLTDPSYRELTAPATLRLADGMPLVWASRVQGQPLRGRVAGSDLIWTVCARAAREGRSVYFLGGNPGAAEAAAAKLSELNPGLRVSGTECPPLGFERDPTYLAGMRERLRAAAPDICLVALSAPKQDMVIRSMVGEFPQVWFMGIGISFSFVSGEVRRAPVWMRKTGLEWMHRLVQEPRRLARRYLLDGMPFAARLFAGAMVARLRGVPEANQGPESSCEDQPQTPVDVSVAAVAEVEGNVG